jgi:hypothetical protein
MAYLNIPYQNSSAYHSVIGATTPAQLLNRKRYTIGAIEYHAGEGNAEQVSFFKCDLALIEKRLTMLWGRRRVLKISVVLPHATDTNR